MMGTDYHVDLLVRIGGGNQTLIAPHGFTPPASWSEPLGPKWYVLESRPMLPWTKRRKVAILYERRPAFADHDHSVGVEYWVPDYLRAHLKGRYTVVAGPFYGDPNSTG